MPLAFSALSARSARRSIASSWNSFICTASAFSTLARHSSSTFFFSRSVVGTRSPLAVLARAALAAGRHVVLIEREVDAVKAGGHFLWTGEPVCTAKRAQIDRLLRFL